MPFASRYRYSGRNRRRPGPNSLLLTCAVLHKNLHVNFVLQGLNRDKLPESHENRGFQIPKRPTFTRFANFTK